MPSGLLSILNTAFGFGIQRALRLKKSQSSHLIESCYPRKNSRATARGSTCEVLNYSSVRCNRVAMAASGTVAASGDLILDTLVSGCGNVSSFAKPSGVYFSARSGRNCRKACVSMRTVAANGHKGVQGYFMFDLTERSCISNPPLATRSNNFRTFSSSYYSDGTMPEMSTEGSSCTDERISLAISDERASGDQVLKLLSGACYLPHPAKEETGGEDAHFICVDEQVIGVADGVGGWADVGINAGEYSRELMSNSVRAIQDEAIGGIDPLRVLEKAHAKTKAMGSSTACIIALKNQGLNAINLGDSGFIVVRDGQTVFESPVQQHSFNFTYQLENDPRGDLPSSGQVFTITVAPGDVVVAGTDGLFDNLYNKEIAAVVADATKDGLSPDATAQKIAAFARLRALDRKRQTPFSTAAQEAGYSYYGGKLDDLTVVVSHVSV